MIETISFILLGYCFLGFVQNERSSKVSMKMIDFAYMLAIYDLYKFGSNNCWDGIQKELSKYNKQVANTFNPIRWFGMNDFVRDIPKEVIEQYNNRFGENVIKVLQELSSPSKENRMEDGKEFVKMVDKLASNKQISA